MKMSPSPSLADLTRIFARIALLSFGGPAGQIAVMHRILVDERRWISDRRFLHALNFCMLLPGPEAQQLATYVGWLLRGGRGGLIAGGLFVLPGLLSIMALSIIYAVWGDVGWIAALFFGLRAAVLAIVLQAVVRIGRRALATPASRLLAVASFAAIFAFGTPFPAIVAVAGLIGWLGSRTGRDAFAMRRTVAASGGLPDEATLLGEESRVLTPEARRGALRAGLAAVLLWLAPVVLLLVLAPGTVWADIARFFSQMAVVTFGGAYAVLTYVAQEAVGTYGWLRPGEMLDGLGLAETTPGPLIMVVQFVGFLAAFRDAGALSPLVAGALGGLLTTWVTFAPCFAWIFLGAPWIERLRGNAALSAALSAVTAAVVGVIVNLAVWFALHSVFGTGDRVTAGILDMPVPVWATLDPWAAGLTALALIAVLILNAGLAVVLGGAALTGIGLHLAGVA